jgi:hypothetical protein
MNKYIQCICCRNHATIHAQQLLSIPESVQSTKKEKKQNIFVQSHTFDSIQTYASLLSSKIKLFFFSIQGKLSTWYCYYY